MHDELKSSVAAPESGVCSSAPLIVSRSFYRAGGKRALDLTCSALGLLLLSPVLLAVAVLVKLSSKGPVFYFQGRAGRDGRIFQIVKFRSMRDSRNGNGPVITSAGDDRVTPVGRLLRWSKLDELPQLWNVLRGDMSLVGPRPEHPKYVKGYTDEQRHVLTVRPGITDIASIVYRNEEAVLARSPNPERFYREVILPHKLSLDLEYVADISLVRDLRLILETVKSLLAPHATKPKS
jgi:lipopolysaccharide/colanic/teichoic acid biosynthesis glycosyltransferase